MTNLYNSSGGLDRSQPDGLLLPGRPFHVTTASGGLGQGARLRINIDGTGAAGLRDFCPSIAVSQGVETNGDDFFPSGALTFAGNAVHSKTASGSSYDSGAAFSLPLGPKLTISCSRRDRCRPARPDVFTG